MLVNLSVDEIQALIDSLNYSKQRVRDATATPPEVRRDSLARLESVSSKLRLAKKGGSDSESSTN
jgi:hypothetical protein